MPDPSPTSSPRSFAQGWNGKPGHLAEPVKLSARGGRLEGVSFPIQFKKKKKWEGGKGGKRGKSIEVAILAKEIHKSGPKRL